jgi:hypothetical protein
MTCEACHNQATADDDYCADCRAAIAGFRDAISGNGVCTACGRAAAIDGLCRDCFDEICNAIVANGALPPSERGGGGW